MLGRLGLCCRTIGLILWFLIRALVLPIGLMCWLCVAGPVGFLEWLLLGSRHVWNLWEYVVDVVGSLIPEL